MSTRSHGRAIRAATLILMLGSLGGCATLGSVMSPYSEKFSCKNSDHGQCIHPDKAYADAVAGVASKSDPAVTRDKAMLRDKGERASGRATGAPASPSGFTGYRDAFSAFARWNNCIILAPLFPIGVMGDGNRDGFKYMREGNLRYDQVLLAIVEEISERYRLSFERFGLFGYSGGGHFTHRFLMLQPNRLWGVSIGAPGSVTLLDPTRDWWVGTRNFAELFGQELDIPAMKQVAVQMIVGAADLETWEITHKPGGRNWMPDANHAGTNRPERLASLRDNFAAHGIAARFDLVPNTPHDGVKVVPVVEDFFAGELRRIRAARKAG